MRVVLTDQVFPDVELERSVLAGIGAELFVASGTRAEVLEAAADADALLTTYFALDEQSVAQLSRAKIIARYGIGVDNVDLAAAGARGIVVTNVPDYCVEEVAVHAVAMLLAQWRRLPEAAASLDRGGWGINDLRPIRRLSTSTIGVIGLGRIGREVIRLLRPYGATLLGYDPYVDAVDGVEVVELEELLRRSDGVTMHNPLLPSTRGMIGAEQLRMMPDHAVLVNVSRGPLVVLDDLVEALRSGTIRAAALDVFETEPPDPAQLRDVPGLLVSPHSAFYSEEALAESQRKAVTQVVKVLTGEEPDYRVN